MQWIALVEDELHSKQTCLVGSTSSITILMDDSVTVFIDGRSGDERVLVASQNDCWSPSRSETTTTAPVDLGIQLFPLPIWFSQFPTTTKSPTGTPAYLSALLDGDLKPHHAVPNNTTDIAVR